MMKIKKLRNKYKLKMKTTNRIVNFFIYVFLSLLSVIWLSPIFILFLQSLAGEPGIAFPKYLIPKVITFDNYIKLFTDTTLFNFPRWYLNTLFVAICSCIISTLFVLMVSYAFSRMRFKMRRPMMNVVLILGMFPGFMAMIAIYFILKSIGLTESLLALILVYSGGAGMGYYIAKGFFDTVPKSLDEAAMIDGATQSQIFWQITLPMSKPIIIYTILTTFIAPWVDFIFVSVIMKSNYNNFTVALGLFQMISRENIFTYYSRFCAGAILVAIPITVLFMIMQKYYISGVTGGSVK